MLGLTARESCLRDWLCKSRCGSAQAPGITMSTVRTPLMQKNFPSLTPAQADKAAWEYFASIQRFVDLLSEKVRQQPGFETWLPDYTETSLQAVGESLFPLIEVWWRDPETKQRTTWRPIQGDLTIPVLLDGQRGTDPLVATSQLTPATEDWLLWVGFYMGECLRHRDATLRWERYPSTPSDMLRHYPVLVMQKRKRYWDCFVPFWTPHGTVERCLAGLDGDLRGALVAVFGSNLDLVSRTRHARSASAAND